MFLENDGVARIRKHFTAAGADLWDTTQQMKLTIGAQFRALAFSFDNLDQEVQGLTEEVFQLRKAQHHRDGKDFDEQEHGSGTKPRATGAGGKTGS